MTECLRQFVAFPNKIDTLSRSNPVEHEDLVDKLQKNVRGLNKNIQSVLKDLGFLEAWKLKNSNPQPKYFFMHRREAEPDFMNVFIRELDTTQIFLFLSTGDDKGVGNIVLYGDEKAVADLGNTYVVQLLKNISFI